MKFPEAYLSWSRLKLNLAELLVLSMAKGDHSAGYVDRVFDAADAVAEFREMYFHKPHTPLPANRTGLA